jgi:hypothetical protein
LLTTSNEESPVTSYSFPEAVRWVIEGLTT